MGIQPDQQLSAGTRQAPKGMACRRLILVRSTP